MGSIALRGLRPSYSLLGVNEETDLPISSSYKLEPVIQYPADLPFFVTPSLQLGGTGILTRFPSITPFGLTLGPDLPWADEPSPGTLGLTARWILTTFIATHAGILTSQMFRPSFDNPSTLWERSPTNALLHSVASAPGLSPDSFSAQTRIDQ